MHHHDETSECSSGRSSQDDSCSERSSSSPRQCDCCYCEVFGHGVVSIDNVIIIILGDSFNKKLLTFLRRLEAVIFCVTWNIRI